MKYKNILIISIIFLLTAVISGQSYAATVTYTYDSLNRITNVDYGNGNTEKYTYDAAGNRISLTLSPPDISVLPVSYDFGGVNVGSTSGIQTFTVSNDGNADLVIGAVSITGPDVSEFVMENDSCSGQTIAPSSGDCTVDVVFSPMSGGFKSANLSMPSNDPDTLTLNVPLSGTGTNNLPTSDPNGPYTGIEGQVVTLDGSGSND